MSDKILAIDQGTTGTTCLVIELTGEGSRVLGRGYAEFPQHFPKPGWVEHDLEEIWRSILTAASAALRAAGVEGRELGAIGITNQRETTALWTVQGEPVGHAIVWQDRRTADLCRDLAKRGYTELIRDRTGLVIDPYFSGTKLAWLLDADEAVRSRAERGELRFGTIDSWVVWKLTGGSVHVTDATNASRTMLFDIQRNQWDEELCDIVGKIPSSLLPQVRSCAEVYGTTSGVPGLPDGIPIAGMAGDQQAALVGQACFEPGMAKCTYGTGAFALIITGQDPVPSQHGLVTTIAWRLGSTNTYAIEGSAFVAGAIVQWLRDGLGFFQDSAEIEALAAQVPDTGGVVLVPALAGLGAPYWRPDARGIIRGITRGTTRAHVARAALEGIAMQIYDLLLAMRKDSGRDILVLRVDGGASANNLLMQMQADVLGVQIHRPRIVDTTALGAAYLAALGTGMFSNLSEISSSWQLEQQFDPKASSAQVEARVESWHRAVEQA